MANGFDDIITQLTRQAAAIERALAALREVQGSAAPVAGASSFSVSKARPTKRRGGMTPRKVRLTPEGRERLAKAMKRRWAVKRAGSAVKAAGTKKRGGKKAA